MCESPRLYDRNTFDGRDRDEVKLKLSRNVAEPSTQPQRVGIPVAPSSLPGPILGQKNVTSLIVSRRSHRTPTEPATFRYPCANRRKGSVLLLVRIPLGSLEVLSQLLGSARKGRTTPTDPPREAAPQILSARQAERSGQRPAENLVVDQPWGIQQRS
jgi:hypothetical protein